VGELVKVEPSRPPLQWAKRKEKEQYFKIDDP
jgi:hypothetical protein